MGTRPQHGGSTIGTRYAGKEPRYDPTSGRNYRTAATLEPDDAVRLIDMAQRAGMSVSGMVNILIKSALINPVTDLPFGVDPVAAQQGPLKEAC